MSKSSRNYRKTWRCTYEEEDDRKSEEEEKKKKETGKRAREEEVDKERAKKAREEEDDKKESGKRSREGVRDESEKQGRGERKFEGGRMPGQRMSGQSQSGPSQRRMSGPSQSCPSQRRMSVPSQSGSSQRMSGPGQSRSGMSSNWIDIWGTQSKLEPVIFPEEISRIVFAYPIPICTDKRAVENIFSPIETTAVAPVSVRVGRVWLYRCQKSKWSDGVGYFELENEMSVEHVVAYSSFLLGKQAVSITPLEKERQLRGPPGIMSVPSNCLVLRNAYDNAEHESISYCNKLKSDLSGEFSKYGELRDIQLDYKKGELYLRFASVEVATLVYGKKQKSEGPRYKLISAWYMQPHVFEARYSGDPDRNLKLWKGFYAKQK